jgi:hypothetical protein
MWFDTLRNERSASRPPYETKVNKNPWLKTMTLTPTDYEILTPYTILTVWACVLLLVDLFIPKDRKGITALLAALGLAVTLGFTLAQIGKAEVGFNNMVVLDGFSTS